MTKLAKIAYTVAEAAAACGVSEPVVRRAIAHGDLVVHYVTSHPVLLAEDLHEWIASAPAERPVQGA